MMAETGRIGASEPLSEYEKLERERRRRRIAIIGALFMVGAVSGGIIGAREADRLFDLAHPWPPILCLVIAATFLAAVTIGSIILSRQTDEVERIAKLKATRAGATVYLVGYPIWFLLWKAGFLPEPMHVAIFAIVIVVLLLASLFYRFR